MALDPPALDWQGDAPHSLDFRDAYFSTAGGPAETRHVFLAGNDLPARWRDCRQFVIGETGFGTGLNFLAAWALWRETAPPKARLHYCACEMAPLTVSQLQRAHRVWPELARLSVALCDVWPPPEPGFRRLLLDGGRVSLTLLLGDARELLPQIRGRVDAWFLDGFAPDRNPALWEPELLAHIAARTVPEGSFATYTAAGRVRRALAGAGFRVEKAPGFGRKREMLRGRIDHPASPAQPAPWYALPETRVSERQAVVLGAGLAGAAAAEALGRRGWQVTVVDRHARPAAEASGNAVGVLMPYVAAAPNPMMAWQAAAWRYAINLLKGLPEVEWDQCGVLLAAWNDRERRRQARFLERIRPPEAMVQGVTAQQAGERCGLNVPYGGLWFSEGGWVHPPSLCRVLLQRAGAEFVQAEVAEIRRESGRWRLLDGQDRVFLEAPLLVLAAGSGMMDFGTCRHLPLTRVRGQISAVQTSAKSRSLRGVLCGPAYVTPAREGWHWAGASFDPESDDPKKARDRRENLDNARVLLPRLVTAEAGELDLSEDRVGFRMASPDHLPVVGPILDDLAFRQVYADLSRGFPLYYYPAAPCQPDLWMVCGLGARGLVSAPLAAELLAAQVESEPLPVSGRVADSLHPARFLVRALHRGA